jgi:hypothetical protein
MSWSGSRRATTSKLLATVSFLAFRFPIRLRYDYAGIGCPAFTGCSLCDVVASRLRASSPATTRLTHAGELRKIMQCDGVVAHRTIIEGMGLGLFLRWAYCHLSAPPTNRTAIHNDTSWPKSAYKMQKATVR